MCEEKIGAINDNNGILSKIGSVAYKLKPQQTINDHPKDEGHVILCNLVSSIFHPETIHAVYSSIFSH